LTQITPAQMKAKREAFRLMLDRLIVSVPVMDADSLRRAICSLVEYIKTDMELDEKQEE
jgi:hypothetical protein